MNYEIEFGKHVIRQFSKLTSSQIPKIKSAIAALADNPRPAGYKKLKGYNAYRIRSGDYRIIYEIHDEIITIIIVDVGHRSSIYRDL